MQIMFAVLMGKPREEVYRFLFTIWKSWVRTLIASFA